MQITAMNHVQLAMPEGEEAAARRFYGDVLGMVEIAKPPALAARGGAWFEAGTARLHLGVEAGFHAAKKAHPALVVEGLEALAARLIEAGFAVSWDDALAGVRRFYTADPFGNRIEMMQPLA